MVATGRPSHGVELIGGWPSMGKIARRSGGDQLATRLERAAAAPRRSVRRRGSCAWRGGRGRGRHVARQPAVGGGGRGRSGRGPRVEGRGVGPAGLVASACAQIRTGGYMRTWESPWMPRRMVGASAGSAFMLTHPRAAGRGVSLVATADGGRRRKRGRVTGARPGGLPGRPTRWAATEHDLPLAPRSDLRRTSGGGGGALAALRRTVNRTSYTNETMRAGMAAIGAPARAQSRPIPPPPPPRPLPPLAPRTAPPGSLPAGERCAAASHPPHPPTPTHFHPVRSRRGPPPHTSRECVSSPAGTAAPGRRGRRRPAGAAGGVL